MWRKIFIPHYKHTNYYYKFLAGRLNKDILIHLNVSRFPVLFDSLYHNRTRVNHEWGHFTGSATFDIRKTEGFGNLLLLISNQVLDSLPSCN